MKKFIVLLSFISVLLLFGCSNTPKNVEISEIDSSSAVILTPHSETFEIQDNTTLADFLLDLRDKGELDFEGETSEYGLFINSVNGKANEVISSTLNSSSGYSWMIYIDFLTLDGTIYGLDGTAKNYDGKTLYQANYGAQSIPCLDGHTYALVYEYYEYTW